MHLDFQEAHLIGDVAELSGAQSTRVLHQSYIRLASYTSYMTCTVANDGYYRCSRLEF